LSRRIGLPGASELFRPTQPEAEGRGEQPPASLGPESAAVLDRTLDSDQARRRAAQGSGRVRHDEKITVYVSAEELLALEQARLTLRSRHALAVDRGRMVREAIAAALADLDQNGEGSELVRRLSRP
jgi:hypothetical protein